MAKHDPWDDEEDDLEPSVLFSLPYIPLPISVIIARESGAISHAGLVMWITLAGYVFDKRNEKGWKVWPSQDSLATQVGCSPRHIRRLIEELESAELLKVVLRPMKSSIYDLNPAWNKTVR